MPRYILIDNTSGYIFADTADMPRVAISTSEGFPMTQSDMTGPVDAARWLDEAVIGVHGRDYEELRSNPKDSSTGYHVYRADINGSEAVPLVDDGQSQATIKEVESLCEYVGFVRCRVKEVDTQDAA